MEGPYAPRSDTYGNRYDEMFFYPNIFYSSTKRPDHLGNIFLTNACFGKYLNEKY